MIYLNDELYMFGIINNDDIYDYNNNYNETNIHIPTSNFINFVLIHPLSFFLFFIILPYIFFALSILDHY